MAGLHILCYTLYDMSSLLRSSRHFPQPECREPLDVRCPVRDPVFSFLLNLLFQLLNSLPSRAAVFSESFSEIPLLHTACCAESAALSPKSLQNRRLKIDGPGHFHTPCSGKILPKQGFPLIDRQSSKLLNLINHRRTIRNSHISH